MYCKLAINQIYNHILMYQTLSYFKQSQRAFITFVQWFEMEHEINTAICCRNPLHYKCIFSRRFSYIWFNTNYLKKYNSIKIKILDVPKAMYWSVLVCIFFFLLQLVQSYSQVTALQQLIFLQRCKALERIQSVTLPTGLQSLLGYREPTTKIAENKREIK